MPGPTVMHIRKNCMAQSDLLPHWSVAIWYVKQCIQCMYYLSLRLVYCLHSRVLEYRIREIPWTVERSWFHLEFVRSCSWTVMDLDLFWLVERFCFFSSVRRIRIKKNRHQQKIIGSNKNSRHQKKGNMQKERKGKERKEGSRQGRKEWRKVGRHPQQGQPQHLRGRRCAPPPTPLQLF